MKKYFSLFSIFFALFFNSYGQVSSSEAAQKINELIRELQMEEYRLYQYPEKVSSEIEISTFDKSITSGSFDSWVFFIDKFPFSGWSHPCSYLFVDVNTGKIIKKDWNLPPNELEKWKLLTAIKEPFEIKLFDFKKSSKALLKSGLTPSHCYAVIISGGYNMASNPARYWNDCAAIYTTLVNVYGYADNHIYTLVSDGTNPANDREIASNVYDSSPLDLDGDGDNDIQYAATRANITSVFNTLSGILDSDDYLFVFVTDHGGQESGYDAILYLWGETIKDDQFATEVDKVSAGEITIIMEQCYSGGFIDDLDSPNRVVATACRYNQTSCGMSAYSYNEFVFHWISAVTGEDPYGTSVDADYNTDGFVSMKEAFEYAELNDACAETPQFYSNKYTLGENLTLLGKELCVTTDYVHNVTITSNQIIEDCNIFLFEVTIDNNSNVTFDAENEVYISDSFEAKLGTTVELK